MQSAKVYMDYYTLQLGMVSCLLNQTTVTFTIKTTTAIALQSLVAL